MAQKSDTLCKYYQQGACALGRDCRYSHDRPTAKPSNVCRYYAIGACAYGDRCRYDHVRPSPPAPQRTSSAPSLPKPQLVPMKREEAAEEQKATTAAQRTSLTYSSAAASGAPVEDGADGRRPLCPFHTQKGFCPSSTCVYHHGTRCPTCGLHCLRHDDDADREQHLRDCAEAAEVRQRRLAALQRSAQVECAICLEPVLGKRTAGERRFGILSECTHPFCISCIRNWRGTPGEAGDGTRACPICRKVSYFITPSAYWVEDPDEKRRVIDEYKGQLAKRPCKYFLDGETCPFGSSCFYRHVDKYGREEAKESRPRMYGTADGERSVVRAIRLWDFLEARDRRGRRSPSPPRAQPAEGGAADVNGDNDDGAFPGDSGEYPPEYYGSYDSYEGDMGAHLGAEAHALAMGYGAPYDAHADGTSDVMHGAVGVAGTRTGDDDDDMPTWNDEELAAYFARHAALGGDGDADADVDGAAVAVMATNGGGTVLHGLPPNPWS